LPPLADCATLLGLFHLSGFLLPAQGWVQGQPTVLPGFPVLAMLRKGSVRMRRISLFSVAMMAVFVLAAVVVAPGASAANPLSQLLPIKTGGSHFTGEKDSTENAILEINANEKLECKNDTEEGGQNTDTLGTFRISFKECKETVLGTKCHSAGDSESEGIILTNGTFHFVVDTLGATLGANGVAILLLPEITKFECDGGLTKFEIKGRLLCLLLEPLVAMVTHLFHCIQKEGKQNETSYWSDETLVSGVILETSKNGGAFVASGRLLLSSIGYLGEPVAIMNE
jgi:hypothetical protein